MLDTVQLTLFSYIIMRMSGFIAFNPIWGRRGIPALMKAGMIMALSVTVFFLEPAAPAEPRGMLEFAVCMLLELALGYILGVIMNFFLYVVILAGDIIDTQMGLTMAKIYDAASQSSISMMATLLNIMMILLFFASGAHITLFRMLLTSAELVPFGAVSIGAQIPEAVIGLFIDCTLLAIKLGFPVLAAELMGEVGMGILMKVIPQINVFAVNLELKIIVGMGLMLMLLHPMGEYIIGVERTMLVELQRMLSLLG